MDPQVSKVSLLKKLFPPSPESQKITFAHQTEAAAIAIRSLTQIAILQHVRICLIGDFAVQTYNQEEPAHVLVPNFLASTLANVD